MLGQDGMGEDREKRLMAMGQMAATLAHEIRNPLGSMELFCTLLKKDLTSQPQSLNLAEQIHSGIRTLERIISNCLQFAREIIPQPQELTDVRPFLKNVVDYLQPHADAAGVRLGYVAIGEGSVAIDQHLLRQAVVNLLMNAIEAARSAVEKEHVTEGYAEIVSDLTSLSNWKLSIVDNGTGISEENQSKIFDPFFTTKSSGTGLGLAITHSIITALRGAITVDSTEDEGTTIVVTLPRRFENMDVNANSR